MDPTLANDEGFQAAMAAFEADDTPEDAPEATPPKPVVEAEVAEPPKVAEPEEPAAVEARKPDDFVEFTTPEQKERFNKVFGYAKRLEREMETLKRQQQPVYQPQPDTFAEAKPKLSDFQDADQWAEAVSDWAARKAEHVVSARTEQLHTRQQEREYQTKQQNYEDSRVNEGRSRFGQMEFDNLSAEVANFVTPVMRQTLFQLAAFPEVVVELGKNLHEADRIARLPAIDQIYELKAMDRRISTKQNLNGKQQQTKPTKVEAPGTGTAAATAPSLVKLRKAAFESGRIADFAKVFEQME